MDNMRSDKLFFDEADEAWSCASSLWVSITYEDALFYGRWMSIDSAIKFHMVKSDLVVPVETFIGVISGWLLLSVFECSVTHTPCTAVRIEYVWLMEIIFLALAYGWSYQPCSHLHFAISSQDILAVARLSLNSSLINVKHSVYSYNGTIVLCMW